jgi:hypothetical protein
MTSDSAAVEMTSDSAAVEVTSDSAAVEMTSDSAAVEMTSGYAAVEMTSYETGSQRAVKTLVELAKECAEFVGGVAEMREELRLHIVDGHARGAAAEVQGGDNAAGGREDRDSERAEAYFEFLIDQSVAVAARVSEEHGELVHCGHGAGGMGRKDNAGEVLFELLGGKIGKQDAAHAGAVGRQSAADMEIDGHHDA